MKQARVAVALGAVLLLANCQSSTTLPAGSARAQQVTIPASTLSLMATKGVTPSDPILLRAYKQDSEMEVWKRGRDGRYVHLKTFPICRWSGQLGPKVRQGDRQAPEGFYTVTPAQMNPNSAYYLSFNTGFPNAYDRARGSSGGDLMVHGNCSSAGCYAMTDEAIAEIYAVAREAFAGGQRAFQFQAYPFRMTAENMAKYRADPNIAFWQNLKEGADRFEATREEPRVAVAGTRYRFSVSSEGEAVAAQKSAQDEQRIASLVSGGAPAVRAAYADGGQHASFQGWGASGRNLGDISRPEALAFAGQDVPVAASPAPATLAARPEPAQPGSRTAARPAPARQTATASAGQEPAAAQTSTVAKDASRMAAGTASAPAPERRFYERWLSGMF